MTIEPFTARPDSASFHQGENVACSAHGDRGVAAVSGEGRAPLPFWFNPAH